MNEQHQKVRVWLEALFGDEAVPAFEINSKTIQTLCSLVDINTQMDQDTRLLIEDLEQKRNEYASEANRIQKIISSVGLPLGSLSQSGSASVRILANTALTLDLKDTKMSSYLLGINELSKELQLSKEERMRERHSSAKVLRKTKAALIKNGSLIKLCNERAGACAWMYPMTSNMQIIKRFPCDNGTLLLNIVYGRACTQALSIRAYETLDEQMSLQEPILNKRLKETGFLRQKAEEYQKHFDELQNYQKQVKLEPSLYHSSLEKKYEDMLLLEEKLKPLKSKLETYHSLPPDLSLAKVKLEEAKRELDLSLAKVKLEEAKRELTALEKQLTKNIESMHSM